MSEKWRNENWFTSSWNFAEEVRSSLHFSDHIKIHDVTLRDGEQQAGLIFDYKQKIALAEKLSEMGIPLFTFSITLSNCSKNSPVLTK